MMLQEQIRESFGSIRYTIGPWLTFENGPGGRPLGPPPRSRSH